MHEIGQSPHSSLNEIHTNPPAPRPPTNSLFGAARTFVRSNIKALSLRSIFLKLNAPVAEDACDHASDGIPQTGMRVAAGAYSLLLHMLLTKSPESSIRIPFTLYGCPSLVN